MKKTIRKKKERGIVAESFSYLKESWFDFLLVLGVFALGITLGFIFPSEFGFFNSTLRALAGKVEGMGTFELVKFIFFNNSFNSLKGILWGLILGFVPIFSALLNGVLLGYVSFSAKEISGYGELWRIFPHGIFELPAVLISLGLGLRLGAFIFAKNKIDTLKKRLIYSIILFVCLILPLLLVAAIIESLLIVLTK